MSSNLERAVLPCEYGNEAGRVHRVQECTEPATERVRWVLGVSYYCKNHADIVRSVEAEWDSAEADYLEQP